MKKIRAYDEAGAVHTVMNIATANMPTWPFTVTCDHIENRTSQRPPKSWSATFYGSGQSFEMSGSGACPVKPGEQFKLVRVATPKRRKGK